MRSPHQRLVSSLLLCFAWVFCLALGCGSSDSVGSAGSSTGGATVGSSGGGAGEGNTGSGGTSNTGPDGGTDPSAVCPTSLPALGSSCPALGLKCTFGDDPRPSCRAIMTCGGAQQCNCGSDICPPDKCTTPKTWIGGGPGSGVGLTDRCSWTCPSTTPNAGDACTPPGYCAKPDGTQCGCIGLTPSGGTAWTCLAPPTDSRCPHVAPLVGSPCTDEGLACGNYDLCVTGSRVVCRSAHWNDDFGSCPK
jgi:hypothetical protein